MRRARPVSQPQRTPPLRPTGSGYWPVRVVRPPVDASPPFFFFRAPATTDFYTLSLHDALPILAGGCSKSDNPQSPQGSGVDLSSVPPSEYPLPTAADAARFLNQASFGATEAEVNKVRTYGYRDRKSTRLNSSHVAISYAVFCLK